MFLSSIFPGQCTRVGNEPICGQAGVTLTSLRKGMISKKSGCLERWTSIATKITTNAHIPPMIMTTFSLRRLIRIELMKVLNGIFALSLKPSEYGNQLVNRDFA